jgi:hypothetical protein
MADTLVERLREAAEDDLEGRRSHHAEILREAADRIGLLTRSLEMMRKQSEEAGPLPYVQRRGEIKKRKDDELKSYLDNKFGNTSAQGDGSGE